MQQDRIVVGVDVSKKSLDVAIRPTGEVLSFDNDEAGVSLLVGHLAQQSVGLVVLEATGGLESPLATALALQKIPVAVVNPRQVRDFARAVGTLAKTDRIDAGIIAHFGEAIKPEPRPLPDESAQLLSGIVARRRQLIEMLVMEQNRLATTPLKLRKDISEHIDYLKRRIKDSDKDLHKTLKDTPIWCEKDNLLQGIPGVGPILSATIIANLPELGSLDRRQVAALVGLAPFNCDSGKYKGRRSIRGGRPEIREPLYMATLNAIRWNPAIKEFYKRLVTAGKLKKVAIVACMRKLLTMMNAMMRDNQPWRACLNG